MVSYCFKVLKNKPANVRSHDLNPLLKKAYTLLSKQGKAYCKYEDMQEHLFMLPMSLTFIETK